MSQLKQCPACRGAKKILGLGSMYRECANCSGVGWLSEKTLPDVPPQKEKPTKALQLPLKPKKGRRAKQLDAGA